ncbi:MAG: UDP-2,3-diacylglucosamine diphosphatase [Thermoanaerobaculia bacterium]
MIAVLADSHLGQGPSGLPAFHRALAQARGRGATELYLLGDIFQYLIGDPKFSTPLTRDFLEEIRGFRATGAKVVYVEGNRDFYLRGSYLEKEFDAMGPDASFDAGGRRFFLVHGDGINQRDWPYRFWRFVSKNPVARVAMKLVPESSARRLVSRTERRLRDSNFKHKSRLPVDLIRSFAQKRFARGDHVVLLGHFHQAWSEEMAGGEVRIVPPFLEEQSWLEVDDGGRIAVASLA